MKHQHLKRIRRGVLGLILAVCAMLAAPMTAPAQFAWSGGGATPNWDANVNAGGTFYTNWGSIPVLPGSGHQVTFGTGFASGNPNLNGNRTVNSIIFNSTASFSIVGLAGNSLTLESGNLTRNAASTGTQTINVPVILGASGTWNVNGGGGLVVSKAIGQSSATIGLTKTGSGLLVLGGGSLDTQANTYNGVTTVSAGLLVLDKASGTNAIAGLLQTTAGSGATVQLRHDNQIADSAQVVIDDATLDLNGSDETINGLFGDGGTVSLGGGNLTITGPCTTTDFIRSSTGTLIKTGNSEVDYGGSGSFAAVQLSGGGFLHFHTGSITLTGMAGGIRGVEVTGGASLTIDGGGRLTTSSGGNSLIDGPAGTSARLNGAGTSAEWAAKLSIGDALNGSFTVENLATSSVQNLTVGLSGLGSVLVQSGGHLSATVAGLGSSSSGRATVTVTGPGSLWTGTEIDIGSLGSATMNITAGGVGISSRTSINDTSRLIVDGGSFTTGNLLGLGVLRISDPASNGTALTLNPSTAPGSIFSGWISDASGGPGSIRMNGPGTQTFDGPLSYTGQTTVAGGTLVLPNAVLSGGGTVDIKSSGTLRTAGNIPRALTGSGTLILTNTLTIGDVTSTDGVKFAGRIDIGNKTLVLMDMDHAELSGSITIDKGQISSPFGITLTTTGQLSGAGTISNSFTNNGLVTGTSTGLDFKGIVNGTGSFLGGVTFSGLYSPGASPASVTLENPTFANTLRIELGGLTAGTQFDQLNITGNATLGGTLAVRLINGFIALPGQQFNVMNFASRSGDLAIANETGYAGLGFSRLYTPTSLTLLATGLGGDANLDGKVDVSDLGILATHWQASANWLGADFTADGFVDVSDLGILATNWQAGVSAAPVEDALSFEQALASVGISSTNVPEPTGIAIVIGVTGAVIGRTRRCRKI